MEWAGRMVVDCHGHRVGFRWDAPRREALVRSLLLPCWRETSLRPAVWIGVWRSGSGYRVLRRGEVSMPGDEEALRARLEREIHLEVATRAPRRVFVHAGAVRFGDGVVLLPGASRSGKTTLTRALVERGGVFYSDEFAVLDLQGRVHPYPRPLAERGRRPLPAADLGWHEGLGPVPVRLVLACAFRPDAVFAPREVSPGRAALHLVSHTVSEWEEPERLLAQFSRALAGAACLEGERGEAAEAADWIARPLSKR